MRLKEFAGDFENGSTGTVVTMMNFLKKQAKKKGKDGELSINALKNMMSNSNFGGVDVEAYLDDLQAKGIITDYDDKTLFYSDKPQMPVDDEIGMGLDAPMMPDPGAMANDEMGFEDPMAPAPAGAPQAPMPPEMQEPEFIQPDPVEQMAKSAALKRI